ncbi:hypothetical protein IM40_05870 [Candidatus Paracaedimonas acanthamoebae]|nr:hypothetical protein IM40_05870 [Candidatus Paracaedimonas acanthamoebae]
MAENIQGVDLSTGKLYIPLTLASLSGPNGFGETFGIQYSTLGLPPLIRTWNQDAPTGILGLGWSLTTPAVIRLGNGSIYDTFLLNGQKLILTSIKPNSIYSGNYTLEFVTAINSQLQITYDSYNECWTVIDNNGDIYIYGVIPNTSNWDAIQFGVNWQNTNGQSPASWSGSTIQADSSNQNTYVKVWNIASKSNIYGQKVNYTYNKTSLNVGKSGNPLTYDTASYLVGISVVGGQSLQLFYEEKQPSEYPLPRFNYEMDGSITNAYQDRIETKYLSSAQVFDGLGQLQNIITFNYGFLWDNFNLSSSNSYNRAVMNKRLLTSITITTPDGYEVSPAHTFDYWGYGNTTTQNNNDGYQTYFNSDAFNIMTMQNGDLDGTGFPEGYTLSPYQDASGNTYNQIFGHLKTIQSPEGALTWYSYMQVSQNYNEIGSASDFDTQWQNQLDLKNITPPETEDVTWTCPRPFWGPDGYLVLRWYSEDDSSGSYQMCIVVYEWLGKWVPVITQTFNVGYYDPDPAKDWQIITTGTGFFCLLISGGDKGGTYPGTFHIFNRDPNLPGQWQSHTYNYSIPVLQTYYDPDDNPTANLNCEVNISNNIIALLDKFRFKLYAFAWNGQSWDEIPENFMVLKEIFPPIEPNISNPYYNSTCAILGNSVLVLGSSMSDSSAEACYCIFNYNPSNASNPWAQYPSPIAGTLNDVIYLNSQNPDNGNVWLLQAQPSNGYIVVSALTQDVNQYTTNNLPLIVSWDDNFNISTQKIQQNGNWYFDISTLETDFLPWIGQGNFFSIGNNIYYTTSGAKTAFRYIASPDASMDSNGNIGWESQQLTSNKSNDSFWANLPLPDMTIAAQGTGDITYSFYQYDPTSQTWIEASNVSTVLGSITDTDEIIAIVCFSFQVAGIVFMFLAPLSFLAEALGEGLNMLTMPLSSLSGAIVGTLSASVFSESTAEVVSLVFDQVAQQAEGIGQNFLTNYVIKRSMDNYSNGSFGSFLLCGQQYTLPSLFYNQWVPSSTPGTYGSYQWNNLNLPAPSDVLYLVSSETKAEYDGLAQSSFMLGNYCLPYSYIYYTKSGDKWYFLSTDQVLFFNNGQVIANTSMPTTNIPSQYIDKYSDFKAYPVSDSNDNNPVTSIAYQINAYEGTDDNYGSPLLTAPWGGVLGFLGAFVADPIKHYQQNVDTAVEFGLFMAKDEALEGPVQDYVINKVAVADGYQTNNTFFQFMPQGATYDRATNTARYSQVCIAQGADSYTSSAQQFGWKEYYLYNGGLYYANSPYGNLPYDPASSTDSFSTSNSSQTNAGQYPSLMSGQTYCVRTLISQGNGDFLTGYEVARTQTFYYGFTKNVYDPASGEQLSVQQVVGVVPTLTVTYSSPSITTYTDITEALINNCATLNYSYIFYDLASLYGPWGPTGTSSQIPYRLWLNQQQPLETALPLASLTYTYSLYENNTTLNATYTQSLPGIIAYVQGTMDTTNPYYAFVDDNLYHSQVQTMTWQLSNVTPPSSFAIPDTTWGDAWELTSSQVTTWASSDDLWYPNSSYTWQGNLDGTPQTLQFHFPWATPPTNSADNVWVQGDSVSQISSNGIVLSKVSSLGVPTFSIYDQQYFKNLATFTNAGLAGGVTFYTGFESFENLSPWSLNSASLSSFSTQSYTGNRSLSLDSNSNSVSYQLSYALSETSFSDSRNWVLAITLFSTTEGNAVTLQVSVNGSTSLLSQEVTLGNNWTTLYLSPLNLSTLSTITSIDIGISFSSGTILIDNLSLMPTTESSFAIKRYDSVTNQLLSTASLDDREFNTRYLYDNLKRPLGIVRKGIQPNEIDVVKLVTPYYSRFGNEDTFNADDPNALLTLTAGLNSSAGYYFDFRDGQNPWNGGTVNDRLLILNGGESASFALPEDTSYGYGIQVQLQGYLQNYTTTLSNSSFPTGSTLSLAGQPALGIEYPSSNSYFTGLCSYNSGLYSYTMYFNGNSFNSGTSDINTPSFTDFTPVMASSGQWLIANGYEDNGAVALFGVLQDNNNYGLYHIGNTTSTSYCVYNSGTMPLFPPFLSANKDIYFADATNGVYCVNVGNSINSPGTFNVQNLVTYGGMFGLPIADTYTCTAQPTAGKENQSQIAFPVAIDQSNTSETYICMFDRMSPNALASQPLEDNITLPLAIDNAGNIFAVGTDTLYAFDPSLNLVSQVSLPTPSSTVSQPIVGNGVVAVAFNNGLLCLYTPSLELISQITVDDTITSVLVMNGDKISVVGQNTSTNSLSVYTYNTAGLLITVPYVTSANSSLNIAAYYSQLPLQVTPSACALNLTIDNNQFSQITLGVPSATISMGPYTVNWDASSNQFSLSETPTPVDPVTVAGTQGNWLFALVNPFLYFYADGQQIFTIPLALDALPTGSFSITAGANALSCRDIVLINDPSLKISYRDGANKVRQVQQTADIVLPQQSNSGG